MNYRVRMIVMLLVVSAFSGGSLSYMYENLKEKIAENLRKEIEESVSNLMVFDNYQEKKWKENKVFVCYKEGKVSGYAIIGKGEGFQGKITLLLAMDGKGERILGIDILESQETPGLGAKIDEDWFKSQFSGKGKFPLKLVKLKKPEEEEIEAITGATISSRAVVNLVNSLVEELKEFIEQNG